MKLEIPQSKIIEQLKIQLSMHFFLLDDEKSVIDRYVDGTFKRCEINFQMSDNKYFNKRGGVAYTLTPIILCNI